MNQKTKFDDWQDVRDCDGCQHYWNNTCDAPSDASKSPCKAFLGTRKVFILEDMKTLQKSNKRLKTALTLLAICVGILALWQFFGG